MNTTIPQTVNEASVPASAKRPATTVLTNGRSLAFLAVFMGLIIVANAMWLKADTRPPAWDAARYLVNSLEAYNLIKHPSLSALKDLYLVRNTVRPSIGMVLPTVPFYALLGATDDVATLWTNALYLAIIVFSVYGIGKRLFGPPVGLLAALLIGLNPELIRLSRIYWPELSVVMIASLATYLLLLSDYLRRWVFVLLAGLATAIGMMQRPIFPMVFLAGSIAFVFIGSLVAGVREGGESFRHRLLHRFIPGAVLFGLPSLLLISPFYLKYGRQMINYIAGFQESGTFAPVKDSSSLDSILWYVTNLHTSITRLFAALYIAGLVVFVVALILRRAQASSAILLAWVVVPYVALSLVASKAYSYLAPLYPALALMLAFSVLLLAGKRRAVQAVVSLLVVALAILTFVQFTWAKPLPARLAKDLAIKSELPITGDWRIESIISKINEAASPGRPVLVGVVSAWPQLAEPPLAYDALRINPKMKLIRWTDPMPTLGEADFVIVKSGRIGAVPPRTIEDKNAALVSEVLKHQDSVFYLTHQPIAEFDLPDGSQAMIYRRLIAASAGETEKIGEELVAAGGQGPQAEQVRQQALAASVGPQLQLGKSLLAEKRYKEAVAPFEEALKVDPANVDANQGLARALFALGDCDGAIQHQQAATERLKINGTFTVLGDIFFECHRLDEAVAAYLDAIRITPKEVRTHFVLAQAYMAQGKNKEATAEFKKTIELDKTSEFTDRSRAFLQQLQSQ